MKRPLVLAILAMSVASVAGDQTKVAQAPATVKYGANATVGRTFVHDGVKLYYEVYGTGDPLLVVHGNGGSISDMSDQIAHFRKRADS